MRIGCCGWESLVPKKFGYKNWKEKFNSKLQLYSNIFDTVEINSTFYKIPMERTAARWRNQVSDEFVFSVKAFRGITHLDKFGKKSLEFWKKTEKIAKILKAKFILIQTPKSFKDDLKNLKRVRNFLKKISYDKIVVELRGFSKESIEDLHKEFDVIECVDPFDKKPIKQKIYYFRLHGKPPGKKMYYYKYTKEDLLKLKGIVPKKSWIYFNNIWMCEDAFRFKKLLNEK